ncbi:MAG TPA: SsgA family sporulation/cell division regulator [Acidimicrobiia bacterium]|nr:SsgA family sporulation/cell division regulator [Acidimicrobiia bacterium]
MIRSDFRALLLRSDDKDCRLPVKVRAEYDEADPMAVELIFAHDLPVSSSWKVSYELLERALKQETSVGQGDVKFRQDSAQGRLYVCVRSKTGHADVALPLGFVKEFMAQTEDDYIRAQDILPKQIDEALEAILGAS